MKITITGKQIDLTDGLKARVEEAYAKLDKYFSKETEAIVTLSVQRDEQIVEATIRSGNLIIRVEESTPDMYISIDTSVDVLERQLRKNKTRLEKKMKREFTETVIFDKIPELPTDVEDTKIVRTKVVETKPMSPEEAVLPHAYRRLFYHGQDPTQSLPYCQENKRSTELKIRLFLWFFQLTS